MHAVPQIPGVTLEVYKQSRRLTPDADGFVGELYSGSTTILAVIDPDSHPTIGFFRDGGDHYIAQRDWLTNPRRTESQQQCYDRYLSRRDFPQGTQVYGVKMPLRVDETRSHNTVHYPENMLMLAQFIPHSQPTQIIRVWKVALVSQDGAFFLTMQLAYDTTAHRNAQGQVVLPRFRAHEHLEALLAAHVPAGAALTPERTFRRPAPVSVSGLGTHEGIVDRWYAARNMGCILTNQGPVRVHWRDVPPRPRRRFLVEGESVRFGELTPPPSNPATSWRKLRRPRFALQAREISVCA